MLDRTFCKVLVSYYEMVMHVNCVVHNCIIQNIVCEKGDLVLARYILIQFCEHCLTL